MPRRKFPQVTRHGALRLAPHEQFYISEPLRHRGVTARGLWGEKTVEHWRAQMGHGKLVNRSLLYEPVRNGENHALSITCVLDLLLRVDHDTYVYAAGLHKLLIDEYGHLVTFDPYTVGRILSGLLDLQGDIPTDRQPFGTTSWGGARMIAVKWDDEQAWRWIGDVRARIAARAERDQEELRAGGETSRSEEVWSTLEGLWRP